jgi:hypothetical protein
MFGEFEMMEKYGGYIVNILKALGEVSKTMGSTPMATLQATTALFNAMKGLTVQQSNAIREIIEAAASG